MMLMWIIPILVFAVLWDRPTPTGRSTSWSKIVAILLVVPGLGMLLTGGGMHGYRYGYALPAWSWYVGVALLLLALGTIGFLALRAEHRETEELEILKLRLARGEISLEDYDLLRQKLSS